VTELSQAGILAELPCMGRYLLFSLTQADQLDLRRLGL
jgi:hypothetical protein